MNKLVYLLERTLNSKSKNLTKADEYMFYSPFVSHYKPKLQVNIESQKWHCWVSNQGGHSIYSLFKKVNADTRYFAELKDLVFIPNKSKGETESKVIVSLPRDFQALWKVSKSLYRNQAKSFLHNRGITDWDIKKYKIAFQNIHAVNMNISKRKKQGFILPMQDWLANYLSDFGGSKKYVEHINCSFMEESSLIKIIDDIINPIRSSGYLTLWDSSFK